MSDHLPLAFDNIEIRAAEAFAASRHCAVALRQDVIPYLRPQERPRAERLISVIERQRIFDQGALNEIDGLADLISRRILNGTTTAEQFVADECDIEGGRVLTHEHRTEEADAFARALPLLLELTDCLQDVFDLMHASRALDDLRQRI